MRTKQLGLQLTAAKNELEITRAKGHELRLYETLGVIVGLFLEFTIVKMKRPNTYTFKPK